MVSEEQVLIINTLFPVLALILAGGLLKGVGCLDGTFFAASDRLVYFVLFPLLLFWKIGSAPLGPGTSLYYLLPAACAVFTVFVLSLVVIRLFKVAPFKAGSFNQCCYRFNTYIGMAVVINLFGEKGVQLFSILVGLLIPCINVMAVSVLIWFSGESQAWQQRLSSTLKSLLTNPLIIGCCCGILYARLLGGFPEYIDNTLRLLSSTTLPLALLSIGGALSFQGMRKNVGLALTGAGIKLILFPLIGVVFLALFGVAGLAWKVSLLFFTLPTSTAIYVLSSQLHSDTELASAAIVVSTCGAFFSMSLAIASFPPG